MMRTEFYLRSNLYAADGSLVTNPPLIVFRVVIMKGIRVAFFQMDQLLSLQIFHDLTRFVDGNGKKRCLENETVKYANEQPEHC